MIISVEGKEKAIRNTQHCMKKQAKVHYLGNFKVCLPFLISILAIQGRNEILFCSIRNVIAIERTFTNKFY